MALLNRRRRSPLQLGDLVAAAYDRAARITSDPDRASRLAALAVVRLLVRTGNVRAARRLRVVDEAA
jgi:hypothetical protein